MDKYTTIESWASRLGHIVEKTERGYLWHAPDEPASEVCGSCSQVIDRILERLRGEYKGEE